MRFSWTGATVSLRSSATRAGGKRRLRVLTLPGRLELSQCARVPALLLCRPCDRREAGWVRAECDLTRSRKSLWGRRHLICFSNGMLDYNLYAVMKAFRPTSTTLRLKMLLSKINILRMMKQMKHLGCPHGQLDLIKMSRTYRIMDNHQWQKILALSILKTQSFMTWRPWARLTTLPVQRLTVQLTEDQSSCTPSTQIHYIADQDGKRMNNFMLMLPTSFASAHMIWQWCIMSMPHRTISFLLVFMPL